jgi:hypothetical protein
MSRFASLKTYSWTNSIHDNPFEIKVFARNPEEARQEVFAILAEIERIKPHYKALQEEFFSRHKKEYDEEYNNKETCAQVTTDTSPVEKTIKQLEEEMRALEQEIPADCFNACDASEIFNYTADSVMTNYIDVPKRLGEFIRTTEPNYCGPVRTVSFRSCSCHS